MFDADRNTMPLTVAPSTLRRCDGRVPSMLMLRVWFSQSAMPPSAPPPSLAAALSAAAAASAAPPTVPTIPSAVHVERGTVHTVPVSARPVVVATAAAPDGGATDDASAAERMRMLAAQANHAAQVPSLSLFQP